MEDFTPNFRIFIQNSGFFPETVTRRWGGGGSSSFIGVQNLGILPPKFGIFSPDLGITGPGPRQGPRSPPGVPRGRSWGENLGIEGGNFGNFFDFSGIFWRHFGGVLGEILEEFRGNLGDF